MYQFVVGLAIFFGVHLIPTMPALRNRLRSMLGGVGYQLVFAVLSIAGLIIVFVTYEDANFDPVWNPPTWTRHLTLVLMLPAAILIVAAYVPSRIRDRVRHPMLLSIKIWALAHLLANGELAAIILFASFLAWAVFDRISVKKRGALGPLGSRKGTLSGDIIAVVGGLALYGGIVFWLHPEVIAVPVWPG